MNLRDKVLQWIGRKIFWPRANHEQRTQDSVGLLSIELGERLLKILGGLLFEHVEAGAIQPLTVGRRDANQEIKELRGLRFERARIIFQRRHQERTQLLQGCELRFSKVARRRLGSEIDLSQCKLRGLGRLSGNLSRGRVGLRRWLLLRLRLLRGSSR